LKTISLLGASGSIGQNTLDIVRKNPDKLNLRYFSVHQNVSKLEEMIDEFQPEAVVITDKVAYESVHNKKLNTRILFGEDELINISSEKVDLCINALVGASGVKPTLAAIKSNTNIALANKETLVTAGIIVTKEAERRAVKIFPIDSEHSAIWQCLVGEDWSDIRRIILTASGGPFRGKKHSEMKEITVNEALAHPNWKMGSKITIDSATLMNKGFEVIETYWLYPVNSKQIDVIVHPQSIIHSMVEFKDSSFKAQLGVPDMRMPIQYAISYPERWDLVLDKLNFETLSQLTFEKPDFETFKCLRLAYQSLEESGISPAVLNAANEITNKAFLDKRMKFLDIANINEKVMSKIQNIKDPDIDTILNADNEARILAEEFIKKVN
jgi:1-deoxy-D-xylulose-5-phosphate reductoisomerase